jgi:hypothetical protein
MKYPISLLLLAGLAALSIAPLEAAKPKKSKTPAAPESQWDWWKVHSEGETPKREMMYVDAKSIESVTDLDAIQSGNFDPRNPPKLLTAQGVTVFEDQKKKPARHNGVVVVNCATQKMMFRDSYKQYWQTERFEKVPATRWFSADSDLKFIKIALFVCSPKARTAENNFIRADQAEDPLYSTWAVAWNDVPTPKFTTNKTKEQALADYDKAAAKAQATIDKGTKDAMETRTRILRDEKVTAMEQKALFGKMRSKASPILHSWIGAEERSLVASWGIPSSSYGASGARFITYTEGYATQMEDQYGNVQAGSRNEFYCDMTFEVREGIIKDYRSGGNYCGTASSGKPRGPN